MGVVIDDDGMIVVVINVGFDANRFPARGGGSVHGKIRNLWAPREQSNAI
jgi:hypothetical protein